MNNDSQENSSARSRERRWLRDNRDWLRSEHAGEWVAIEGDQLLAIGPHLEEVMKQARLQGVEVPFVDAVRSKRYQGVTLFRRWS